MLISDTLFNVNKKVVMTKWEYASNHAPWCKVLVFKKIRKNSLEGIESDYYLLKIEC